MSLADTCSGYVFLGAADDKREELDAAVRECRVTPLRSVGRCCWLSVVGDTMAVRERHVHWSARMAQEGIGIRAVEIADRRVTYVLPEDSRAQAVTAVYGLLGPAGPAG
jgi:aspartokinase